MNQMPPFCTCLKMRAECDMRPPCKHVQDSTAVTNTQNHPPMTDLEQLKEQICGKEPVEAEYEVGQYYRSALSGWEDRRITFDATAAAMLELVKGKMPDKMQPRKDDDDIDRANRLGYNDCIREMLTAIQSLQNNDNGKDNQ